MKKIALALLILPASLFAQERILPIEGEVKSALVIKPKVIVDEVQLLEDKAFLRGFKLRLAYLDAKTGALLKEAVVNDVSFGHFDDRTDNMVFANSICRAFGYGPAISQFSMFYSFKPQWPASYIFNPSGVLSIETYFSFTRKYVNSIVWELQELSCARTKE